MSQVTVRPASVADGETLLTLIDGLADFEKLTPPDTAGKQRLLEDLAMDPPRFGALIAELDGVPIGYTAYFEIYSTFLVRKKLYMEDLFVLPGHRSTGAGFALVRALVEEAFRRDCHAIEWECLDWNVVAQRFYSRVGGVHNTEWMRYSMDEAAMRALASAQPAARRDQ